MFSIKKLVCMFLTVLFCLGAFAGCNNKTNEDPPATEPAGTTEEPNQVLTPEDFGNADGSPREFNIMTRSGATRSRYVHSEAASSDRVEQAAFERNAFLEDLYNIDFEIVSTEDKSGTWITNLTNSGGSFDLCVPDYWWGIETQGVFADIMQMPEINLDDPWWYSSWIDVSLINNRLYSILGDASNETVENLPVLFFNKSMAAQYGYNFYEEVENNTWTWERLKEVCREVARNLDDDDTSNDVYGLMTDVHSARNLLGGIGLKLTEKTATGFFQLVENQDANYTLAEEVRSFIHTSGTVNHSTATTRARDRSLFIGGHSLFYGTALLIGERMKSEVSGFKYGVLVSPKYTAESDYISVLGCSMYAIPRAAKDPHLCATVLNAMNYMGADSTMKAFYDIVCQGQVAEQPEDGVQMELARSKASFDFGCIREAEIPLWMNYTRVVDRNLDVASTIGGVLEESRLALAALLNEYMK